MVQFNIQKCGIVTGLYNKTGNPLIQEGNCSAGRFHLINLGKRDLRARLVIPEQLKDSRFLNGWTQKLPQNRTRSEAESDRSWEKGGQFKLAGEEALADFSEHNPGSWFVSDATNWPYNECHFVIENGMMLPLPADSFPAHGKHYVFAIDPEGSASFPLIDIDEPGTFRSLRQAFYVPKIIHEGVPIGLLDEIPGTGRPLVCAFRGAVGQIFKEKDYSGRGTSKRADIHDNIVTWLRAPETYWSVIKDMINGMPVDFGCYGKIRLPHATYCHTYWLEDDDNNLSCLKVFPPQEGDERGGITLAQGPEFLLSVSKVFSFEIKNAYIGTNGNDVRTIMIRDHILTTIEGDYKHRPLASFLAFSFPE